MSNVTYAGPKELVTHGHGFRRTKGNSLSDLAIVSNKYGRLEIGNLALSDEGDRTSAVLAGKGTSTTPVSIGSTGDKNFLGFWVEADHTSGDVRGLYMRLYMGGASGASGEAVRSFTTVQTGGVASAAHGIHASVSFATTGYASGLAAAARCTLHIPDQATWGSGGTYAAVQSEIYSDGAASDAALATELSFLRCVNDGHASGIADVDDDAFLLVYTGGTTGSGNVVESSATEANYAYSARCKLNGTAAYMMFASAVG